MLGILTSLQLLAQRQGRFYLTDVSRNYLLPGSSYYWGGMLAKDRDFPMSGATLREAMQKDKVQNFSGKEEDAPILEEWESGDIDPAQARTFTAAMHSHSFPAAMGVARWGNFSGVDMEKALNRKRLPKWEPF